MCRIAVLAAAAGCLVALASGCAARQSGGQTSPRPSPTRVRVLTDAGPVEAVPWVGRVAPRYEPTSAAPPSSTAQFAPCGASQLAGRAGGASIGAGNLSVHLTITNISARPCALTSGPSSAIGIGTDGIRQPLSASALQPGAFNLNGPPANLRPGQIADAVIDGGDGPGICVDSHRYDFAAVDIGVTTGVVRVKFTGTGGWWAGRKSLTLYACGSGTPGVFGFGVPAGLSDTPSASPLDVLTVSRSMPSVLTPGSTVTYTITLGNPTGRPVVLSPCPSYTEFIMLAGAKPSFLGTSYYLNCRAAPLIAAHGSVTFQMKTSVPAGTGAAKYGWLIPGTTLETGGVVSLSD